MKYSGKYLIAISLFFLFSNFLTSLSVNAEIAKPRLAKKEIKQKSERTKRANRRARLRRIAIKKNTTLARNSVNFLSNHVSHLSELSPDSFKVLDKAKKSNTSKIEAKSAALFNKEINKKTSTTQIDDMAPSPWLKMMVSLSLVFAAILLLSRLVNRKFKKSNSFKKILGLSSSDLEVVQNLNLGAKNRLAHIRFKEKDLLIGIHPQNMSLLWADTQIQESQSLSVSKEVPKEIIEEVKPLIQTKEVEEKSVKIEEETKSFQEKSFSQKEESLTQKIESAIMKLKPINKKSSSANDQKDEFERVMLTQLDQSGNLQAKKINAYL